MRSIQIAYTGKCRPLADGAGLAHMFVVLHLPGSSADRRLSALSCSIPVLLVLSASELCVCGDACSILLLLGDGYLPGRQVGLCARKR